MYSYIGYTGTERHATASGIINATLTEDSRTLDEVVVVGYGVQKKSSVTGAISQVKSEDMLRMPPRRPYTVLQPEMAWC